MKVIQAEIYVELLEEGTPCWRPVLAEPLRNDTYRVIGPAPDSEVWMFQPGDVVQCELRELSDGSVLVASHLMPIE